MSDELHTLREEVALLQRRLERERKARHLAELLAEQGTRALYDRQSELALLADLAIAANSNAPVPDTLRLILGRMAEFGDWQVGHIFQADEKNGAQLESTNLWYLASPRLFDAFVEASQSTRYSPDQGLPGRVWRQDHALLIEDLERDCPFPRLSAASACGLVSGFAFPVRTSTGLTAVIELYSIRRHEHDELLERLLPQIIAQIGRVFEREATTQAQIRAKEELERTVRERTAELSRSLDELEHRIQQKRQLQRSLLVQDRALAASIDSIFITNAERIIVYCNPAFERLNGYSREEAVGQSAAFVLGLQRDMEALGRLRETLARGENGLIEVITYRKDGAPIWSELRVSPVHDEHDAVTHFIAFQKDVSARRQEEERQQALLEAKEQTNAELARVARLKDEFLASMSHELRTPLNVVLGQTSMLQERLFGPLTDRQAEMVSSIDESGRHLLDLINDILDVSKIEAGKLTLVESPVEVSGVVRGSLFFIRQAALRKELTIEQDVPQDTPLILADGRRLKQLLVNLLSNALKFTPEGGRIGLTVRFDAVSRRVFFTVWDTGIGIAPGDLERIFQPFEQIDSRLTRRYNGTGLGLWLVRRLANLHGGDVSCESELGRGSRFIVSLPWREVSLDAETPQPLPEPSSVTPRAEPPPPPVAPAQRVRVLLAEDNQINQMMFTDYLWLHGCQITLAQNGAEAVALATKEPPEIILMDVQMPEMDGIEAMRRIRATPATAQTPIIALTALAMPSDERRCLEAGANHYLSKPVRLSELKDKVFELVSRR